MAGQILSDRYEIEKQLGKKSGRWTFLAQDLLSQSRVILKLLFIDDELEPTDLKLFKREIDTLQQIDHPGTPRLLDYFEITLPRDGKALALVHTYVTGLSLAQNLQQGRRLKEAEARYVAQKVLEVLVYLHQHSPPIVHRDIRPDNILLEKDAAGNWPQVYLINFGSVKSLSPGSTAFTRVGLDGYVPPEQVGGRAMAVSDLYSLGATLINAMTDQHPTDLQVGMNIEFESAVSLSPKFTDWLERLIAPMLDQRWPSAADALAALNP
ncbi:MAG: serine/threonine protein kinase [Leptolyngbyaceae cyanobacterium SM1_1_3]|nr:serine/threonine protein kinase [Leptolyngbyaceae cyanobacterium SM1_1_3]NJN01343.1 serine/threonine protein kinase [Leptolyngbyaceae cyanobacterium RM1_1_2]NJO10694.1 serine/threonine protein kinase [Leptolyngbyaceae cyanobacterium SL_1_1]